MLFKSFLALTRICGHSSRGGVESRLGVGRVSGVLRVVHDELAKEDDEDDLEQDHHRDVAIATPVRRLQFAPHLVLFVVTCLE